MHNEDQLQPMTFTELLGLNLFHDADSMFSMGVSYFCLPRFDMEAPIKPREIVRWNTGTRFHKPKKGKGSYDRKRRDNRRRSI